MTTKPRNPKIHITLVFGNASYREDRKHGRDPITLRPWETVTRTWKLDRYDPACPWISEEEAIEAADTRHDQLNAAVKALRSATDTVNDAGVDLADYMEAHPETDMIARSTPSARKLEEAAWAARMEAKQIEIASKPRRTEAEILAELGF